MEYIPIVALALTGMGVTIASLSLRHNRSLARLQIMEHLMQEYRAPDMLAALTRLHRLRDYCDEAGKDIKNEYDQQFNKDQAALAARGGSKDAVEYSTGTLHNQRRLVSHFYNRMYWLIEHRAVPASLVFSYWNRGDIDRLFNRILIPIQRDPVEWLIGLYKACLSSTSRHARAAIVAIVFVSAWGASIAILSVLVALGIICPFK